MIEIIENFTDKFKVVKESQLTNFTQLTEELTFSNKFITEEHSNPKSTVSDENQTQKSENLSAQLPKRLSRLPNKLIHILSKSIRIFEKFLSYFIFSKKQKSFLKLNYFFFCRKWRTIFQRKRRREICFF